MDRFATPMGLNEITETQRARILDYVREGMSLRSIERITGHRRETIARYARRAGLGVRVRPTARPPAAPRRARRDAR